MPQFLDTVGTAIRTGSQYGYNPEAKAFLDAFVGQNIEKQDETGRFTLNPATGDFQLESPRGLKLNVNPRQRSVEGSFRFGGPDTSIQQSEILPQMGVENPLEQMSPAKQELEAMLYDYREGNPDWWRPQ